MPIAVVVTANLQGKLGLLQRHRSVTMGTTPLAKGSDRACEAIASGFTLDHPVAAAATTP